MASRKELLEIGGRDVSISNPDKVYFPETGYTKMDLVSYYLSVADGGLRGAGGRPMALKRFVDGAAGEPFFQKRAPDNTPDWIRTAELTFPSGRTADEIVLDEPAGLAWVVNPGRLGPRSRRRGACAVDRDEQVVEGRASRRLPRLQPEREGPDRRLGVLRPAAPGRQGLDAASLGRGRRRRRRGLHPRHGPRDRRLAGRRRRRDRRGRRFARGAPRAEPPPRGGGTRRRAVATELREAGG